MSGWNDETGELLLLMFMADRVEWREREKETVGETEKESVGKRENRLGERKSCDCFKR